MKKRFEIDRGVNYAHYDNEKPVRATVSFNDTRMVFDGTFTITETSNSWKFGQEIQFRLWTKQPILTEKRSNNNGWNEISFYLPKEDAKRLLFELVKELK